MIRRLDGAGVVLLALRLGGKHLRQQIVGAHAQDVEGDLLPGPRAQHRQRSGRIPAPAYAPHGSAQRRLREHLVDGARREEVEHGLERKAVLRTERQEDAFVGGRRLQLEVEGPAEPLAQRQTESAVLLRPERGVHHELHPARLVEEALRDQGPLGGQGTQRVPAGAQVAHDLLRACLRDRALADQELLRARRIVEQRLDLPAQARDLLGQLRGAPRRFPVPERERRGRSVRVLDPDPAGLDPADLTALVAEQEDVAGHALHGPIFIHLSDGDAFGLGDDGVLRGLRNGAAAGKRGDARSPPCLHHAMDAVPVQPRALRPPRAARHTFRVHLDHGVEFGAGKLAVGPGPTYPRVRLVLRQVLAGGHGDELLREHVERPLRNAGRFQVAGSHAAHQRRALDELIARGRKEPALGHAAAMVGGAADALQGHREAAGRLELHDQVDRADVDAQLQRGGGDGAAHLAALELLLCREPHGPRHAAVVRNHLVLAEPLRELVRDAFHVPARVHEHQRGPVLADQLGHAFAGLLPLLLGSDRVQLVARHFELHIERTPRSALDDRARPSPGEEASDLLDGPLGRGEADPHASTPTERIQPLERDRQVRAALVAGDRVDLVDDHRPHRPQHAAAASARQQEVEALRRRDQDVRRLAQHRLPLGLRGVPGAHGGADLRDAGQQPQRRERLEQVHADVVGERLQRRDVEHLRLAGQGIALPDHRVEAGEEGGERFSRAGRGRDQGIFAGLDPGPAQCLWLRRRAVARLEPGADRGVESFEHQGFPPRRT